MHIWKQLVALEHSPSKTIRRATKDLGVVKCKFVTFDKRLRHVRSSCEWSASSTGVSMNGQWLSPSDRIFEIVIFSTNRLYRPQKHSWESCAISLFHLNGYPFCTMKGNVSYFSIVFRKNEALTLYCHILYNPCWWHLLRIAVDSEGLWVNYSMGSMMDGSPLWSNDRRWLRLI